jgi:uncharacterized membrane protein (UPF0127 family)
MDKLKSLGFLALGLVVIGWSFYTVFNKPAPAKYQPVEAETAPITAHTLRVGGFVLPTEIADTPAAREQGFSGRERPLSGHGILFIFDEPAVVAFWMKDMRFPLDIVWIGEDWTVVGVEKNASPESFPQTFSPRAPVRYVLELPAGDAAAFGIDTGTKLYLDQ